MSLQSPTVSNDSTSEIKVNSNEEVQEMIEETPEKVNSDNEEQKRVDSEDDDVQEKDDAENPEQQEKVNSTKKTIESDDEDEDAIQRTIESDDDKVQRTIDSDDDDDENEKAIESDNGTQEKVDSDDETRKKIDSDDDDPKFLRVENAESGGEGREWDFDVMMRQKKAERKHKRKSKDGSFLLSDADDLVKAIVDDMTDAANDDRQSNMEKRPAIQKRKMLKAVRSTLLRMDLFEALLDNGMMSAVSDWLAPLPDKSLPALEVRTTLLSILQSYPRLEQGILKQSGLGKAVMFLFKHPKETRENKIIASKLIREWSRPIFQLDTDFRSLGREDRLARDLAQMPEAKRTKLNLDEDGIPIQDSPRASTSQNKGSKASDVTSDPSTAKILRPGDPGFINRARVPRPSTKDYVIRPKTLIEGTFQGASKSRATSRLDRTQREFLARTKTQQVKRAVGVSIEGRKMSL